MPSNVVGSTIPQAERELLLKRLEFRTDRPRLPVDILNDIRATVRDLSHSTHGHLVYQSVIALQLLTNNLGRYEQAPQLLRDVCIESADVLASHLANERLNRLVGEFVGALRWEAN